MMKRIFALLLITALTLIGSALAEPDMTDELLVGQWQTPNGKAAMAIEKNPGGEAWDLEITMTLPDDARIFKTTIRYDDELHCFAYNKGKFWDVPAAGTESELGEAKLMGTIGTFTFAGDDLDSWLNWEDDEGFDGTVYFHKIRTAAAAG